MSATLTDLEAVVLGVIRRVGPCTAYQVHQVFLRSPSLHFSGSAGAIYPLVGRMETRDLLALTAGRTGKRKHKLLSLTAEGHRALNEWMTNFELAADAGFDPLRARMSVWPEPFDAQTWRDYLSELDTALAARLETVKAAVGTDRETGMSLDRAREVEIATLEAKKSLIRKWIADD